MRLQKKKTSIFQLVLIFKGFVETDINDHDIVDVTGSNSIEIFDGDENIDIDIDECVGSEKENHVNSGI